jgi:hypothetical protein
MNTVWQSKKENITVVCTPNGWVALIGCYKKDHAKIYDDMNYCHKLNLHSLYRIHQAEDLIRIA